MQDFDEAMASTDHIIDAIFGTNPLESKVINTDYRFQF